VKRGPIYVLPDSNFSRDPWQLEQALLANADMFAFMLLGAGPLLVLSLGVVACGARAQSSPGRSTANEARDGGQSAGASEPLLDKCVVVGTAALRHGDVCALDAECGARGNGSATCNNDGSNTICGCWIDDGTAEYIVLDGEEGADACEAVLDLCVERTTVSLPEDYVCDAPEPVELQNECRKTSTCGREAVLGNGLTAVEVINPTVNCSLLEGAGSCWCSQFPGGAAGVEVAAAESPELCNLAFEICMGTESPKPSAKPKCELVAAEDTKESCTLERRCEQQTALEAGALSLVTSPGVSCHPGAGADWQCNCRDNGRVVDIRQAPESDSGATCLAASERCAAAFTVPMTTPIECSLVPLDDESERCYFSGACSVSGEADGLRVSRSLSTGNSCTQSPDDPSAWTCTCSAPIIDAFPLRMTVPPDGPGACELATDACKSMLDIVRDTGGYGIGG
jgi:hypothetical protein